MLCLEITPMTQAIFARRAPATTVYDFTGAALPPGIGLTRASTGTGFGPTGTILSFASGAPRLSADPALPAAGKGLLVEPSRTNLFTYSEGNASTWSNTSAVTTNLALNALGRFAGIQIAALNNNQNWNRTRKFVDLTAAQPCVATVFYRAGTSGKGLFMFKQEPSGSTSEAQGSIGSLAVSGTSAGSISILSDILLGDGLTRRLRLGFTPAITSTHSLGIGPFTTVSGETIVVLGVQIETGSFATSYIPTTASAVMRAAEAISSSLSAGTYNAVATAVGGGIQTLSGIALAAGGWPVLGSRHLARVEFTRA